MENPMQEILVLATALAPLITAVVQAFKVVLSVNKRFMPLVGMIVGIALGGLSTTFMGISVIEGAWAGLISGLTAVGLFELGKGTKEAIDNE